MTCHARLSSVLSPQSQAAVENTHAMFAPTQTTKNNQKESLEVRESPEGEAGNF